MHVCITLRYIEICKIPGHQSPSCRIYIYPVTQVTQMSQITRVAQVSPVTTVTQVTRVTQVT